MVAKIDRCKAGDQSDGSYGVRKGLTIREEIALAFRVGQAHFDAFPFADSPTAQATRRFVRGLLSEALGFADLGDEVGTIAGLDGSRVPVIIVPPSESIDRRSPTLSTDRPRSPALALQDYLNQHEQALWGLVSNGTKLRLMRDNASLTRHAHIEADLEQIFSTDDIASFAALWLIVHRSRFGSEDTPATDCALERWREAGAVEGETARNRLAIQVEAALRVLGSGFIDANPELATRLHSSDLSLTAWFNELLRLVYRLIFLMVAEDRNLLHPPSSRAGARTLYADGYSLGALREQSVRRSAWDGHHDRYEGMKVVFRALTIGENRLALPGLGGLFSEVQLPNLAEARIRNSAFMEAIYRLAWLSDQGGRVPVNWRAMETEELGSVYESLLELQPQLADGGRRLEFASDVAEQKGNQRKTTGSYYTPESLVQALLDSALEPVLDRTEARADDREAALLDLKVIDPACGSGHFLLAAARRIATRVARIRADGSPSAADVRHALRDVASRCIHGVDRNPMAVELAKVALWIETVDPGLPLGFFDAQIRCGDALVGVFDLSVLEQGIPDDAYKSLTGDDGAVAAACRGANRDTKTGQARFAFETGKVKLPAMRPLAIGFAGLRDLQEDTVKQIDQKVRQFQQLRRGKSFERMKAAADLYVAAFLMPKTGDVQSSQHAYMVPTTEDVWSILGGGGYPRSMQGAVRVIREARVFHWPLEFPDVMARGGFDVVLGNPPWERIKLQEKEFFGARRPEIEQARNKAERGRLIQALATAPEASADQRLYKEFVSAKRESEAVSAFVRTAAKEGGRFIRTGRGDINTYALFAELFSQLSRDRAGLIVPTGIATDATTADFFADLVTERRLARLVDFENRSKIFRAIDSRIKFCLLTLGRDEGVARFAFFLTEPGQLAEPARNFTLTPEQIAAINPNTRTAPVFRSRADADLTAKIYANAPVLVDHTKGAAGNPWGVKFARMFDMSNDSGLFRTALQLAEAGYVREGTDWVREGAERATEGSASSGSLADGLLLGVAKPLAERYVPLYEAKMIHQFDHRWASYDEEGKKTANVELTDKQDPTFEPAPRYWVPVEEVNERLAALGWSRRWLMGWRDITNATNERTVISTVFPRVAVGNKIVLILPEPSRLPELISSICANMCSLILDYSARNKLGGTTINYFILRQFPLFTPSFYRDNRLNFVRPRLCELIYTSHEMAPFARDLGYKGPPFPWRNDQRRQLRAELDCFYARAYGLTRDELRYTLDPSEVRGTDYPSETFRILRDREIRQIGEYRTRRLILSVWDKMESTGQFEELGL